jgi:hypothetical protein
MIVSRSRVTFFVGIEASMDQGWVGTIDATAETCVAVTYMKCHLTRDCRFRYSSSARHMKML